MVRALYKTSRDDRRFCMVDWTVVACNSLGIPEAVAGVTVLAAGT